MDTSQEFVLPCTNKYGQAENCSHNALAVHGFLLRGRSVAIPLALDGYTRLHISFVPLSTSVPHNTSYIDGSGHTGIQINIDRMGSYAVGMGDKMMEEGYIAEKWDISKASAKFLLFFFQTVLTGKDHFKEYGQDVMHKLLKNKKAYVEGGE